MKLLRPYKGMRRFGETIMDCMIEEVREEDRIYNNIDMYFPDYPTEFERIRVRLYHAEHGPIRLQASMMARRIIR